MKEGLCRCWAWLADENNRGRVIAIAAVAGTIIALLTLIISSSIAPHSEVRLSMDKFLATLENREREVEQRLTLAHGEERARLENELTEVKRQLSDIGPAYADALKQISELEVALVRLGDDISENRLRRFARR